MGRKSQDEETEGGTMSELFKHGSPVTRRGFIAAAGTAVGAAALAGAPKLSTLAFAEAGTATPSEEVFTVSCVGNCGGLDSMHCHVVDGKACSITNCPLPERNREQICQRGMSNIYRIYDDRRIKYPMRRVGERGSNEFERISWDEAISEICEKWKGYISEFGSTSVGVFGGSGSQRADSNADFGTGGQGYIGRLMSYLHLTKIIMDADSTGMASYGEMVGGGLAAFGNDWADLKHAQNMVCWGSNPTESQVTRYRHIKQAQDAGVKLTVIDPNFTITASKADRFIPIRPASDGLLAIAMMRKIIREGLQDTEFLAAKTVAPYLVKDSDGMYLRASDLGKATAGADDDLPLVVNAAGDVVVHTEANGAKITGVVEAAGFKVHTAYDLLADRVLNSEWTDEQIREWTEVDQDTIDELVDMFVNTDVTLLVAYGPDHYTNGHTFYFNVLALQMLCGNFGRSGVGIVGADVSRLIGGGADVSAMNSPEDGEIGYVVYSNYLDQLLDEGRLGTDDPCTLKSIYIQACNVIGNQADRLKLIETFNKIDFIVCADIAFNDTTKYCDILLPVCHWWESWGYVPIEGYMRVSEKAIDELYESKCDIDIINLLLSGMGLPDKAISVDDYFTRAFENDDAKHFGITWEKLKEQKIIRCVDVEVGEPVYNGMAKLSTATGKYQFYREGCRPVPDFGQEWDYSRERLPYWEPPTEAWFTTEAARKYPIHFISERPKFKVHTMFSYVPDLLEILPEPTVQLSVADAQARGIETGDTVRIFNDRGDCTLKATVNAGLRPGVMQMDHGWQDEQFIDGHYQNLTSRKTSYVFANNCYHDCMADVEKIG